MKTDSVATVQQDDTDRKMHECLDNLLKQVKTLTTISSEGVSFGKFQLELIEAQDSAVVVGSVKVTHVISSNVPIRRF